MKNTFVIVLALLCSTVAVAEQAAQSTERSFKSALPSVDEVATVADLGGKLFQRFRARRNAVLALWVDGRQVDHIAAATGYTIPNVIQTIENYKAAVERHEDRIKTLAYEDPFPMQLPELLMPVWREVDVSTSGTLPRKAFRIYLKGAAHYGTISKQAGSVWEAAVEADSFGGRVVDGGPWTSYWFSKQDAVDAVKKELSVRLQRAK